MLGVWWPVWETKRGQGVGGRSFGELLALLVVLVLVKLVLALEELGFLCDAGSLVARVGEEGRQAGGWEPRLTEH